MRLKILSLLLLAVTACAVPDQNVGTAARLRTVSSTEAAPTLRRGTVLHGEQWPEDYDWPALPLVYEDTLFLCGQRSGLFSPHTGGLSDREAWNAKRPITLKGVTFLSEDPNYPCEVGKTGTYWGSRAHLINSCYVDDLVARDIFGSSYGGQVDDLVTSNEGHVLYWTLAPDAQSQYILKNIDIRNTGGHAMQFVTATGAREGLDAPPRPGGYMLIENAYIENTDQSPARGSSSISFFDLPITVDLNNVTVRHGVGGIPYPRWGWDGNPETAHTARGCLVQRGWMLELNAYLCTFEQLGGRPDRPAVSLRGVEVASFERCTFKGDLEINGKDVEFMTKRIVIKDCRAGGNLIIGGNVIGPLSRNYDLQILP